MKLIQHIDPSPDWPEWGHTGAGARVRLRDVEALIQAGAAREAVYYDDAKGIRRYPWKGAGFYVDEFGEPIAPVGPDAPSMTRIALRGLGLEDEALAELHASYFGPPPAGTPALTTALPDTPATQVLRRRLYDEAMAEAYGPDDEDDA